VQAAESVTQAASGRDEMIESVARQLDALGYRVFARGGVGGRAEPVPVNGHVPDLRARGFDGIILVAVETAESLFTSESEERWRAFGRSYFSFHVVVPGGVAAEARRLARTRDVRVDRFWLF
jgi:hypothetical protein